MASLGHNEFMLIFIRSHHAVVDKMQEDVTSACKEANVFANVNLSIFVLEKKSFKNSNNLHTKYGIYVPETGGVSI